MRALQKENNDSCATFEYYNVILSFKFSFLLNLHFKVRNATLIIYDMM